ncbi:helix-turn-helix domain-containing protein [Nibrella saemangeumensis]|uniref:Helix-turn-helix domain-containing protein n=1 Tax=Nibrella saemangeumensis TaxID=1084526 RepID=A0ABP8NAG8_9BACT
MEAGITYQRYAPAPELASYVSHYAYYENRADWAWEFALPDGLPSLVFILHQPHHLQLFTPGKAAIECRQAYLTGAYSQGIYVPRQAQTQRLFSIRFTAEGIYHLLRQPVAGLRGQPAWPAELVLGAWLPALTEQVLTSSTVGQLIGATETYLRRQLARYPAQDLRFQEAVQRIVTSRGQQSIDSLAVHLKVSYKWLERRFQTYLGLSPKEFARLNRFIHTYFSFRRQGLQDLLGLAVENGFYDQTHFNKEFRYFTNQTPTGLYRADVQDLAHLFATAYRPGHP